jgi:putative zinc finger/helix-turn-helix YgiT family protein
MSAPEALNTMNCFECGDGTLRPQRIHLDGERNGEFFTVTMDGLRCEQCGFQTIDSNQSAEFTRLVSDAYRSAHGLLTGAEIRARRQAMGMTQAEFAAYLGTGVASVKRWESGQIQEKGMDELIRLKTDPEAAKRNLDSVVSHIPEPRVLAIAPGIELTFAGEQLWWAPEAAMTVDFDEADFDAGQSCVLAA